MPTTLPCPDLYNILCKILWLSLNEAFFLIHSSLKNKNLTIGILLPSAASLSIPLPLAHCAPASLLGGLKMLSLFPPWALHVLCPLPGSLFLQMVLWLYLTVFRSLLKCLPHRENFSLTTPGKRETHALTLTHIHLCSLTLLHLFLALITADRVIYLFTLFLPHWMGCAHVLHHRDYNVFSKDFYIMGAQ